MCHWVVLGGLRHVAPMVQLVGLPADISQAVADGDGIRGLRGGAAGGGIRTYQKAKANEASMQGIHEAGSYYSHQMLVSVTSVTSDPLTSQPASRLTHRHYP